MPRTLSAGQIAEFSKQIIEHFYLVSIETSASTRYYSTGSSDLTYNGNLYLATSDVIKIGDYEEEQSLSTNSKEVIFSGANQSNYNIMLTEFSAGKSVKIFLVLDFGTIVPLFDGTISSMQISDEGDLVVECNNKWAEVLATGRKHSVASQQRFYPNDIGFSMNKGLTDRKIEWGRGVK